MGEKKEWSVYDSEVDVECSNCKGKVVVGKAGAIFAVVVIFYFGYYSGAFHEREIQSEECDQRVEAIIQADQEHYFELRDAFEDRLWDCEYHLRRATNIGYTDDGFPLDPMWDIYYLEHLLYPHPLLPGDSFP